MSGNWSVKQKLREDVIDAVLKGDKVNAEKYLDEGADVDESQGGYLSKETLLMIAIENNHEDIARMLVARRADLTCSVIVDKKEKTAVQLAREKDLNSLAQLIEQTKVANEELLAAAKCDNVENAEAAITKGANINMKHTDPDKPDLPNASVLMLTVCHKSTSVARLLIEKGVDVTYTIQCEEKSEGESIDKTARTLSVKMEQNEITQLIDDALTAEENETENMDTESNTEVETPNGTGRVEGDLVDCDENEFQETDNDTKKRTQKSGSICTII